MDEVGVVEGRRADYHGLGGEQLGDDVVAVAYGDVVGGECTQWPAHALE